jgi:hypothetical protein
MRLVRCSPASLKLMRPTVFTATEIKSVVLEEAGAWADTAHQHPDRTNAHAVFLNHGGGPSPDQIRSPPLYFRHANLRSRATCNNSALSDLSADDGLADSDLIEALYRISSVGAR